MKQRKLKSTRKARDQVGHWTGDPECRGAPRDRGVCATDAGDSDSGHEVMVSEVMAATVESESARAIPGEVLNSGLLKRIKDHLRRVGAACVISVMGRAWWEAYLAVA